MTRHDRDAVDAILGIELRERAADVGGENELYGTILAAAAATRQRRQWWPTSRPSSVNAMAGLGVAATVVVAAIAAFGLLTRFDGTIGGATASPNPTASPPRTASPAQAPSLIWNPSSLERDWPAPVRAEPVGGAKVTPVTASGVEHGDEVADIGGAALPWIDIASTTITADTTGEAGSVDLIIGLELSGAPPTPFPDPSDQWIAYGLVVDTNGDGMADARYGIDNMPNDEEPTHRAWITDLATGVTKSAAGGPYGLVGNEFFDTLFPGEGCCGQGARFDIERPLLATSFRLYMWASAIENGRVIATDYAPDDGWFDPWPEGFVRTTPEPEAGTECGVEFLDHCRVAVRSALEVTGQSRDDVNLVRVDPTPSDGSAAVGTRLTVRMYEDAHGATEPIVVEVTIWPDGRAEGRLVP